VPFFLRQRIGELVTTAAGKIYQFTESDRGLGVKIGGFDLFNEYFTAVNGIAYIIEGVLIPYDE